MPVARGSGNVTISTAGEPALVEEVTGRVEATSGDGYDGITYRTVCPATPCKAELVPGDHALKLTSLADPLHNGTGTLTVDTQPLVYRYQLGHQTQQPLRGSLFLLPLGTLALTLGGFVAGVGPSSTERWIGGGMMTAGAALVVLGAKLLSGARGEVQNGTGIQWTP